MGLILHVQLCSWNYCSTVALSARNWLAAKNKHANRTMQAIKSKWCSIESPPITSAVRPDTAERCNWQHCKHECQTSSFYATVAIENLTRMGSDGWWQYHCNELTQSITSANNPGKKALKSTTQWQWKMIKKFFMPPMQHLGKQGPYHRASLHHVASGARWCAVNKSIYHHKRLSSTLKNVWNHTYCKYMR